jgi:hypothetical protein
LVNGNVISGMGVQIAQDSTFWLESKTGHKCSIPTSEVSQIVFGVYGLPIGAVVGSREKFVINKIEK